MSLCCVYSPTEPMRVVEDAEADELVKSGQWFKHPNDAKNGVIENEQKSRKQRSSSKQPVCEETAS